MREFKFRVFSKERMRMFYFNIADIYQEGFLRGGGQGFNLWAHEDKDVMQYIGIEDTNKTPIYEGDIVKTKWQHCGVTNFDYEVIGKIIYSNNYLSFKISSSDKDDLFICDHGKEKLLSIEVIGNVYENPGLLKECKDEA